MKEQSIRIVICLLVFALFPLSSSFAAFNLGGLGKVVTDVVSEQNGHNKLQEDYNKLQEDYNKLSADHKKLAIQKGRQIDRLTDTVVQKDKEAGKQTRQIVKEKSEENRVTDWSKLSDDAMIAEWAKLTKKERTAVYLKLSVDEQCRIYRVAEEKEEERRLADQERSREESRRRAEEEEEIRIATKRIQEQDRIRIAAKRAEKAKKVEEEEAKRAEEARKATIAQNKRAEEQRQSSGLDLKDKYLDAHIFFPSYAGGPTEKWITLREFADTLFSSPKAQVPIKISSVEYEGSIGFNLKVPGEKSVIFLFSYDVGDLFPAYGGTLDNLESMAGASESAVMGVVMKALVKGIREMY